MIRLRSFAASAGHMYRSFAASAGHMYRSFAASAGLVAAFVVFAGSTDLLACPACSSAEEAPLIDAARMGVLVMLGITLAVQGAFAGFFFYLRNNARRLADEELDAEWSELERPSRTS